MELGAKYAAEGADELVYLDISATEEGRQTFTELVARIAERIDIPFTVGGGIASVADAGRLLDAGADKVMKELGCVSAMSFEGSSSPNMRVNKHETVLNSKAASGSAEKGMQCALVFK